MTGKKNSFYSVTGIVLMLCVLVLPVTGADIIEYPNTNLPGSDYSTVAATDKMDCAMACLLDDNCLAATWVSQRDQDAFCQLKNAVPAKTAVPPNSSLVMHSFIKTGAAATPVTQPCVPVTAGFTADTTYGPAPLSVRFTDTTNGDGETVWIWGDGSQLSAAPRSEVDHTFSKPGVYTVNLTVRNLCSGSFASATINVYGAGAAPAQGSLKITGVPDGAVLSIDGVRYGTFPMNPPILTAGSHSVRITMSGYEDYKTDVMIRANQQAVLNLVVTAQNTQSPLVPTPPPGQTVTDSPLKKALMELDQTPAATVGAAGTGGTLIVSSVPEGANVYIDGKSAGMTPLTLSDILPGQHILLLTRQGYTDASRSVSVSAGSETRVAVDMTVARKTPGFAAAAGVLSLALLVMFRKRTG
jgi:PKD repeat protein